MRFAQYLVLVILGIGGLFLGDYMGPLSAILFDWDVMMDPDFSRAIRRYHGIVVGACAMLPMLIASRLFSINELTVFVTALILGTVFYLLPSVRHGELLSVYAFVSLPSLVAPYVVGTLASIGAMSLSCKLWSLVRAVQRS